jgi:Domain of unknown function (DUF4384)
VEQSRKVSQNDPATMNRLLGNRMQAIANPAPSFSVELWTERDTRGNGGGAKQAGEYRIGDRVVFCFRVSRESYVTLLNVGTSGKRTILFPTRPTGTTLSRPTR